jgi:nucleotide-binding universal stress UspA family protein
VRVLTATNGSSRAEAALRLGAQIARQSHEPLTILTVIKHEADGPPAPVDTILAQACEIVQPQFTEVCTRVRIGHPATEIVREAGEGNYDLVIVGERPNRNLVARFLLGSTAVRVLEHAPCPVIVAKGKIGPIQRILLCDSGSQDPSVGLPPASHPSTVPSTGRTGPSVLSRFTEIPIGLLDGVGEIVILHVMSQMSAGPGVKGKQLRSDTEELLEERAPEGELLRRDIEKLESLGLRARARVRHGLVVEEILEEAQSGDYDLVVIGAYRGQGWQRILLDDLAHRIVVELDRPVLVVR